MGIEHVARPQQKEKINNKRAMPRGHCTQLVLCRLVYSSLVDITTLLYPNTNIERSSALAGISICYPYMVGKAIWYMYLGGDRFSSPILDPILSLNFWDNNRSDELGQKYTR